MINITICLIYKINQEVFAMLLKEEINKYLNYCKFQKELNDKTIKAYKADLEQFITVIGENNPDKETLNSYLLYLHCMYKQKTVKRKIASVKALFHYLEEEEIIEINPFHKVKTKFKEEVVLPKIIPRDIIEQLLNHLYKERSIKEYSEWRKKNHFKGYCSSGNTFFNRTSYFGVVPFTK